MSDEDATGATDDADPGPAADGDRPEGTTPEEPDAAERLLARIAEYDETLAEDVRRIIERGAELQEATADLETALDERDEDVAALQAEVEDLEAELDDRETEIDDLEAEVEDLRDRLRRKQADFQNYKKRAERERERIEERATEDLVERLLDVRDNLRRAVEEDDPDVESLLDGVEMTLREFDRVLDDEDVVEIAPELGDEIDPTRHEVMMRADSDQPEDTVADVYAPGYEMAGEVIRPARVTVSTGPADDDTDARGEADAAPTGDE